ncbi:MAG: FliH/SctL family protein [Myxococcaceae bacterium]
MKRPSFMQGVPSAPPDAPASAPRVRSVSWLPSAPEPAMPELKPLLPVAPPTPLPPPPAAAFVALPSAPPPQPTPPPPPPPGPSEAVKAAVEKLRLQGERLAEQARSDALELGILIARRILEREIRTDLGALFALIKSAIRRAGEDHVTRVRVHPADHAAFGAQPASEFSLGPIQLVADAALQRGDVVVETEHHEIDGRLSTRLDAIIKQLEEAGP